MQPETPSAPPVSEPQIPQEPSQEPAVTPQQPSDPGMTLGIIGLVLTVIGIGLVGLILAIIGLVKSKKAGFQNIPAWIAIGLNVLLLVVVLPIIALLVLTTFSGVQERAKLSESQTAANSVIAQTEAFYANQGVYPSSPSELLNGEQTLMSSKVTFVKSELNSEPVTPSSVAYYSCGRPGVVAGVKVGYWNYDTKTVVYKYSLGLSDKSSCTFSAN